MTPISCNYETGDKLLGKRIIDNHLASLMARTGRKVNNRLTAKLRTVGLSLDAWLVLNMLVTEGGRSMGEIAEALVLNLPTATKLIDRMVNDNLVTENRIMKTGVL